MMWALQRSQWFQASSQEHLPRPMPSAFLEALRRIPIPPPLERAQHTGIQIPTAWKRGPQVNPGPSKHRVYTLGAAGSGSLLGFFSSILATVSRCTSSGPSAKRRARAQAKN